MDGFMATYILAALAVILVGIAKAGFGGGVGIAAVPLFILAFDDSKMALGIMLPILVVCDWFALWHYRNTFDKANLFRLLPPIIAGIIAGSFFLGEISDEQLKFWIGVVSILFVMYQLGKKWVFKHETAFQPTPWHSWGYGVTIGITSTLAHAAGPPATMYLLPQNLGKRLYVGTSVVLFTLINAIKLIPYFLLGMITFPRLGTSLSLMLVVPIGTFLGVWMNQKINETVFNYIIYAIMIMVGIKFTTGFDPLSYALGVG